MKIFLLDRFNLELQTSSKSIQDATLFFEVVQIITLLSVNTEGVKLIVSKFTGFYDKISDTKLFLKIPKLRRHSKTG